QQSARHHVYSGHIVDRCEDLEAAYSEILARCYNRRADEFARSDYTYMSEDGPKQSRAGGNYGIARPPLHRAGPPWEAGGPRAVGNCADRLRDSGVTMSRGSTGSSPTNTAYHEAG